MNLLTPEELWDREYQRWLARQEKRRARSRWRYANEPGYAERRRQYSREYMRRYRANTSVRATDAPV